MHLSGVLRHPLVPAESALYDRLEQELFRHKSLAALATLISGGRELEFTYRGERYFLSRSKSQQGVSLWKGEQETSRADIWQLLSDARLGEQPFLEAWDACTLETLF